MADVLAYEELVRLAGIASKYAGDETMNCAMSFASWYFSRKIVRSSAIAAP